MKLFRSEYLNDYSNYTFGYAIYAVKEEQGDITPIYNSGFLPYTGNPRLKYPVFYLGRSIRIDLENFSSSSENKRVDRKSQDLNPQVNRFKITEFDIENNEFTDFCLNYAHERFSNNAMDKSRLKYILHSGIATDIFRFTPAADSDETLGYVLAVVNDEILHYWFSFYDTSYISEFALGKWMMWRMIKWSKDNGLKYTFLGTAYGEKSLYKIRDFKALEFFDGNNWNNDIKLLKSLCKTGVEFQKGDLFKRAEDPNKYIESLFY